MFSFQGQKPSAVPFRQRDSFTQAIADLDSIPFAFQQTGRSRTLSTTSTECNTPNDAQSNFSTHFQSHPAVGWDRVASGSTLKAYEGAESPKPDVEEKGKAVPPPPPPLAVGFWDKALRDTRNRVFLKYAFTCEYR